MKFQNILVMKSVVNKQIDIERSTIIDHLFQCLIIIFETCFIV